MHSPQKILFDHVQKTAGISCNEVLKRNLGADAVVTGLVESHQAVLRQFPDKLAISGHLRFSPLERLSPYHFYLSILRHPVDRAISLYYYYRSSPSRSRELDLAKARDIREYFFCKEDHLYNHFRNHQTAHFMQTEYDGKSNPSEIEQYQLAKKSLERYDLIGTHDLFSEFIDVLCKVFGWPLISEKPRLNLTAHRPQVSQVPADVIDYLTEINQADILLFEHARELFREKQQAVERFTTEQSHQTQQVAGQFQETVPKESVELPRSRVLRPLDDGTTPELIEVKVEGDLTRNSNLYSGETATIRVVFKVFSLIQDLNIYLQIRDRLGGLVFGINSKDLGYWFESIDQGVYYVDYRLRMDIQQGPYAIDIALQSGVCHSHESLNWLDRAVSFNIYGNLGHCFTGTTKLYPTLNYGCLEENEPTLKVVRKSCIGLDTSQPQKLTHCESILTEFSANIEVFSVVDRIRAAEVFVVEAEITNTSRQTWQISAEFPIYLSYHWLSLDGNTLEHDGLRTSLPREILPGEKFLATITIKAPHQSGTAILQLTLVQENIAWFEAGGMPTRDLSVRIT